MVMAVTVRVGIKSAGQGAGPWLTAPNGSEATAVTGQEYGAAITQLEVERNNSATRR
jgi:hypothetical protein